MCSLGSLRQWVDALLPGQTVCSRGAARELLRALLVGFHTQLGQLARQADRTISARGTRQFFHRWLSRSHWEPTALYTQLHRFTRRLLARQAQVLLIIDTTTMARQWVVLQVSTPWQNRALPLFRVVYPYAGPHRDQGEALDQALTWLGQHLPGPRRRYVLLLDRGFPSQILISRFQREGWRYVLRVKNRWRIEHSEHTGQLREAVAQGRVTAEPRLLREAGVGTRGRGANRWLRAHVVWFHGVGHQEPWFLITSEADAAGAIALYRQRMRIEAEFRDLKGPLGLDLLAHWCDRDRVARFLAWMAVYEWRLAYLWEKHQLVHFQRHWQIKGKLSWIRTVREWIGHQLRLMAGPAPACL
jgi:hypothetical protein